MMNTKGAGAGLLVGLDDLKVFSTRTIPRFCHSPQPQVCPELPLPTSQLGSTTRTTEKQHLRADLTHLTLHISQFSFKTPPHSKGDFFFHSNSSLLGSS